MEYSSSLQVSSCQCGQEIPRNLWNPMIYIVLHTIIISKGVLLLCCYACLAVSASVSPEHRNACELSFKMKKIRCLSNVRCE